MVHPSRWKILQRSEKGLGFCDSRVVAEHTPVKNRQGAALAINV